LAQQNSPRGQGEARGNIAALAFPAVALVVRVYFFGITWDRGSLIIGKLVFSGLFVVATTLIVLTVRRQSIRFKLLQIGAFIFQSLAFAVLIYWFPGFSHFFEI
jgi:hypothetical protein